MTVPNRADQEACHLCIITTTVQNCADQQAWHWYNDCLGPVQAQANTDDHTSGIRSSSQTTVGVCFVFRPPVSDFANLSFALPKYGQRHLASVEQIICSWYRHNYVPSANKRGNL